MFTVEKIEKQARREAKEKAEKLAARLNKDKIKEVFYNASTKETLLVTYCLGKTKATCLVEYKNPNGLTFNYAKDEFIHKAGVLSLCFIYTLLTLILDFENNKHNFKKWMHEYETNFDFRDPLSMLKANGFELIFQTHLGD